MGSDFVLPASSPGKGLEPFRAPGLLLCLRFLHASKTNLSWPLLLQVSPDALKFFFFVPAVFPHLGSSPKPMGKARPRRSGGARVTVWFIKSHPFPLLFQKHSTRSFTKPGIFDPAPKTSRCHKETPILFKARRTLRAAFSFIRLPKDAEQRHIQQLLGRRQHGVDSSARLFLLILGNPATKSGIPYFPDSGSPFPGPAPRAKTYGTPHGP